MPFSEIVSKLFRSGETLAKSAGTAAENALAKEAAAAWRAPLIQDAVNDQTKTLLEKLNSKGFMVTGEKLNLTRSIDGKAMEFAGENLGFHMRSGNGAVDNLIANGTPTKIQIVGAPSAMRGLELVKTDAAAGGIFGEGRQAASKQIFVDVREGRIVSEDKLGLTGYRWFKDPTEAIEQSLASKERALQLITKAENKSGLFEISPKSIQMRAVDLSLENSASIEYSFPYRGTAYVTPFTNRVKGKGADAFEPHHSLRDVVRVRVPEDPFAPWLSTAKTAGADVQHRFFQPVSNIGNVDPELIGKRAQMLGLPVKSSFETVSSELQRRRLIETLGLKSSSSISDIRSYLDRIK